VNETRKILEDPTIQVTATTVRVPVYVGHSESVNIETEKSSRERGSCDPVHRTGGQFMMIRNERFIRHRSRWREGRGVCRPDTGRRIDPNGLTSGSWRITYAKELPECGPDCRGVDQRIRYGDRNIQH